MATKSPSVHDGPRGLQAMTKTSSGAATKKTRATSCTSCRQVKLKCDLRAQHPCPCTRCKENGSKCQTDATFKRVTARGRVKDLENELEMMKRDQGNAGVGLQSISERPLVPPLPLRHFSPEPSGTPIGQHRSNSLPADQGPGSAWLRVTGTQPWEAYSIGNVVLSGADVLDLFQQFEILYYPHFAILEPVDSLASLAEKSALLFWTIVRITARHHVDFQQRLYDLRAAYMELFGRVCIEAIQSLHDLQAVLMLCAWPYQFAREQQDPSWMYLGMVVNAARHMGLDKPTDEVLFGNRLARHSLSKHPLSVRRLTWLKIFELDVQMSLWLGQPPTLSLHHYFRSIKQCCTDPSIPPSYAACIEIHLQAAQYLDSAGGSSEGTLSTVLMRQYSRALYELKERYSDIWNFDAEIALLGAQVYLHAICLIKPDGGGLPASYSETLQLARLAATKLANLLIKQSEDLLQSEVSSKHASGSHPLPGHAKTDSRLAYFATIVCIKYLDSVGNDQTPESEEARNAFSGIFSMFRQCLKTTKHFDATMELELAGRAIGTGEAHIHDYVTTRMGASLMYNVVWTAAYLRGRERDPAFMSNVNPPAFQTARSMPVLPPLQSTAVASETNTSGLNGSSSQQQNAFQARPDDTEGVVEFPFGVWNDATFDTWAAKARNDTGLLWDPDLAMFDFNGQTFGLS